MEKKTAVSRASAIVVHFRSGVAGGITLVTRPTFDPPVDVVEERRCAPRVPYCVRDHLQTIS